MASTQILVVDDLHQWRIKVRSILEGIKGFRVVAEAGDALEAIEKAARFRPDIVVLDIGLPLLNGIEAAPRIQQASPGSKIIFLTQEQDSDIRAAALATGAEGFVLKSNAASELRSALEGVARMSVLADHAPNFQECSSGSNRPLDYKNVESVP